LDRCAIHVRWPKIDKSFVRRIIGDAQDRAIVAGIINLGQQTNRAA
jgi:EAL domain-containing protein (putative c-di-GMP-specific phosphodiesterase class I)